MSSKRTVKDDLEHYERLLAEDGIKSEVVAELKQLVKVLSEERVSILTALIDATGRLQQYRHNSLAAAQKAVEWIEAHPTGCVPGCTKHEWHDADGWHRTGEDA